MCFLPSSLANSSPICKQFDEFAKVTSNPIDRDREVTNTRNRLSLVTSLVKIVTIVS